MPLKGRRRYSRKMSMKGTKTEVTRKRVPRISTINKKIKRLEDTRELKYNDVFVNAADFDNSGQFYLLNGIATGDTQTQRTGAEVQSTSLQIRGSLIADPTTTRAVVLRMIVFWDRQANGANPQLVSTGVGTPALLYSPAGGRSVDLPFMYETQDRFRVLLDKRYVFNPQQARVVTPATGTTAEVIPIEIIFKKKIKLNRRVKYDDVNGLIDDINTNSLFVAFFSDDTAPDIPNVTFNSRFYFKDA